MKVKTFILAFLMMTSPFLFGHVADEITLRGNLEASTLNGVSNTNTDDVVLTGTVATAVAKIGTQEFETLADAVAEAQSGDEIVMLSDATLEAELTIPAGITLNGNGYQINGSITKANIQIDATGMNIGDVININANLDNHVGTLEVVNGNLDAKIENGKIVFVEKPVASVNGVEYFNLQEAIVAAAPSGTVEIINDVTVDKWIMFSERLGIGSGQIITIEKIDGLTINGNNHSLTINSIESASNGNRLFYDATELNIKDLTINYAEGVVGGIGLTSGIINNVTFNGGVGVLPGTGEITISGCTFNTSGSAIYNEEDRDNLVVTGNTFNTAEGQYAIYLRGNTTFTDNIVKVGKVNVTNSGTGLISGNDFGTERFKVYNAATATIENNKINNLVFNDESTVFSTFGVNTLSVEALEVLTSASFPVAQIGDVKYGTLQEAFNAVQNDETIVLLTDIELTKAISFTKDITFTIDGKGKTIKPDVSSTETNSAFNFGQGNDATVANKNYTIKNIVFDNWTTDHVVRLQGVNATVENCTFQNCKQGTNALGLLTLTFCEAKVEACTFKDNECVKAIDVNSWGDDSEKVSNIDECIFNNNTCSGPAVVLKSDGTINLKNSDFIKNTVTTTGNAATVYVGFGSGNTVEGCYFENNTITTTHATTKRIASAIFCDGDTVKGNVFGEGNTATRNGETIKTTVAVGAYYGAANISENYWGGEEPEKDTDYTVEYSEEVAMESYYTTVEIDEDGNITLGGLVELPKGDQPIGYVSETTIWGETWSNARESYVIKVKDAEGNVMGTSTLNPELYTFNGNQAPTWHISFDPSTDNDTYWIQEWTTAPSIDNMPAKVALWVDGVEVNEGLIKFNGPDDLNKMYAATADAEGKLIRFYNSIETIVNNDENVNVVLVRDVTGSFEAFHNVTLYSGVEGGAAITNTYDSDYTDFNNVIVKNGVTLNISDVLSSADTENTSVNTIEGTLNVAGVYYHSNDAKTNIQNGGKVTTGGMTIVRYNYKPESGIYIYGDGDDATVEFSCQGDAIGAYSGTFYAENAVVETKGLRLDYKKDASEEPNECAQINAQFVDSKLDVSSELRLYKDAALTLDGATVTAGKVQIRQDATPTINVNNSTIKANSVENLSGATWNAVMDENGYVTFVRTGLAGDGSEANPYLINNVDDLVLFRDMVNTYSSDGSNQFRGKFVKLTNDIDLEGINWTPIGTNTVGDHSAFLGTFYGEKADGTIPTISNLYINADGDHLGFFARVGNFGDEGCTPTIKNIKFNNVDVSSNTTNGHGGSYVAGVIANAGGNTVISNIEVTGDLYVVGYGYIGGIVGHGYPDIDNCHVRANDGSYIQSHYWCCGGIIGYAGEGGTPITNSSVSGVDIWAKSGGAAAIAGLLQNGNKIENVSASNVEITSNSDYCMGYIAGNGEESILTEISIENVTATANGKPITATDAVAQIEDNIYFSLQDALNDSGNITVLRDVNITETIKVAADKEVTLDLNGKTIDGTEKVRIAIMSYGNLTVKDSTEEQLGTIKAGIGTAGNAINICAGTFTLESGNIYSKNNAILIDEQAAIVNIVGGNITAEPTTNNSAVFYISSTSETTVNIESGEMTGYNGVLLWNNTTLNITGGTINATGNTAIQGNGMYDNTEINISGENTSITGYYAAIYHPQGGELNISDGILSGWSGVVVKGGNVNISGGTINGTGEANDYRPVSSGYVDTGDALYVEHFDNSTNSGNYGTPTVTVTGGTFNSTNAKPIASYANPNNAANGVEALANFVSGGTFSGEIEQNLLAEGFELVQNEDDTYGVVEELLKGKGTEDDPYLIENLEDLIAFRNSVNAGETKFNAPGVWVALADDIDMAGTNWTDGIGDGINATFDGCFDGKNYTIKNFTMEAYADSDGYVCGGLFGYIYGKNGAVVIRNLVMENVTITCDAERTGDVNNEPHNIGALVGFAMRCENSIINNIIVKGDITIDAQNVDGVGAIVGYSHTAAPKITNCKVVANDGSYIKGHSFVGGITGYSYSNATITDCTVENIDIIGTSYSVGGIAGIVLANNVIKNCTVSENVEVNGQANVGYLVGAISSNGIVVNIENCSAKDPMIGGNYGNNQAVIARIENKYYSTLQAAFAAANNETVTLIADIELSEMITIPNGKTVTLDLNGKTITGTDTTSKNFSLIDNRGNLTITDSSEPSTGKMTLTATVNSGWNRYSAVIANNPGGKLTIENGTLEHLGGTDMAYGIDNLTNGKGTYAETVINGGYIKSTYRGVRQFLNGVEAQNILTVNGGTIEGANKSIWMQDPSKNANTGTLTVGANAELKGDVYLFVTAGSTEWPVEISIAAAALAEGSTVLTGNVPAGYDVQNVNGTYGVVNVVAQIGDVKYQTLKEAVSSATDGATIQLIWAEGNAPIAMNADLYGKNVTITGTATVDWNKNFLFVGRGGEGNATLTFDNANLTSASNSASYGIHVSGREKNTNNKYDGTLIINNSTIELDYLINKGAITLDNSEFTVKNGFSIGGRPAHETESGEDATATITLNNGSKVIVNKHNGMGLGYEAIGVMNIDATSTFETTQAFLITAKGTLNNAGTVSINGALTNNGTINFTDLGATLTTTTVDLNINDLIDNIEYKIVYEDETYKYIQMPSQEQSLVAGWNWYSTYLDITLNDLTTTLGDNGISIKNFNGVNVENLGNNLWFGQLNEINPSEMYLIETTTECDLKLAADLLNPNDHIISLNAGWNWIGYPSNQEGVNINDALKDLNANPGDIIKSLNNGYAEYAFGQWLGTLNTMVPGVGYKYNNKSGEAKTFYYNIEATRGAVEANVTAENNYWTPNATKYPHNMTMTAVVDGLTNGNYEVAAFVNGEVRGSARPVYVEALDAHIFFLTIHGEDVEEMSFRLYDIDTDTEYDLNDRINYSNDAHLGSVSEPYVFSRGTTGIGEAALSEINIYPNPTTTGSTIRLQTICDTVEVFNALGVKVAEYHNVDSIDALETAGIYVIRITNNGNTQNCRLVVK